MSQKLCVKGNACEYHKLGKCKFAHSPADKKSVKVSKTKAGCKGQPGTRAQHLAVHKLMEATKVNIAARKTLSAELKTSIGSYFDVKDKKDVGAVPELYSRQLKLLDDELAALKSAAKSIFGIHHFILSVYYYWTISITVTTGAVIGNQNVDPSAQTEFIAAAALFDEYKVEALDIDYRCKTAVNYSSVERPHGIIAYDPTGNALLTGITEGRQVEQHQLFLMPSTYEAISYGASHKFLVKVPPGIQESNFSTGTGNWLPVNAPLPYGYTKFYAIGDNKLAVTDGGFGASIKCTVHFRIRE